MYLLIVEPSSLKFSIVISLCLKIQIETIRITISNVNLYILIAKPNIRPSILCGMHFAKTISTGFSKNASSSGVKTNAFSANNNFAAYEVVVG